MMQGLVHLPISPTLKNCINQDDTGFVVLTVDSDIAVAKTSHTCFLLSRNQGPYSPGYLAAMQYFSDEAPSVLCSTISIQRLVV